jgi:hypothetical protein
MINSGQSETVAGIVPASGYYRDQPVEEIRDHPQEESGGALCGVFHQNDSGDSNFVNGLLIEFGHFLGAKDQHCFPPAAKGLAGCAPLSPRFFSWFRVSRRDMMNCEETRKSARKYHIETERIIQKLRA